MAKRITVYRIEDSRRRGPYHHGDCGWQTRCHDVNNFAPTPWNDGIETWSNRHVFGFKSMEALKRWFSSKRERKNLHKEGYFIAVYRPNATTIKHGRKQIAFIRNKRRSRKISLARIK